MRINTNVSALSAARNLTNTQNAVAASTQKLSSGFRITRAADDAAGLGTANVLRSDIRAYNQATRNAEQANSVYSIAEGAASSVQSMLERMKELATQAASDTVDSNGRGRINDEFTQLASEIDRTVSGTKFQGGALLDGTYAATFLVGASGDYTGNDTLTVDGSKMDLSTTTLGVGSSTVDTLSNAQDALTALDTAIGKVNSALGYIGASQSRMENAVSNLKTTVQNYSAAESTIRDVDMADEMVNFSKNNILAQAGTAILAQANQAGQGILKLLG
ncbi:flagellin [bacterium]|nr:flagellin [bacterium]